MTRKTYAFPFIFREGHDPDGLTRYNLTERIYKEMPWLTPDEIRHALDTFFGVIEDGLANWQSVDLKDFGVLEPMWRKPREIWVKRRRRIESHPGSMKVNFEQAPIWGKTREGFEYLAPITFEKRLLAKRRRETAAYIEKARKKKPR